MYLDLVSWQNKYRPLAIKISKMGKIQIYFLANLIIKNISIRMATINKKISSFVRFQIILQCIFIN